MEFMQRKVITICGSTKFKDEYAAVNKMLTLQGYIVLSVGFFMHCEIETITDAQKTKLDALHMDKISMSDEIYVINKHNYIDVTTASEIEFATKLGRKINYYQESELPFFTGFDG